MTAARTGHVVHSACLLLLLLTLGPPAHAGKVAWTARLEPADARAGEAAQVVLTGQAEPGWHVYSLKKVVNGPLPTSITLKPGALLASGPAVQPEPHREHDPNFGLEVEYYVGAVAFGLPVTVKPGLAGAQTAAVDVRYMACSGNTCTPPTTETVPVRFEVAPGAARADHASVVAAVPAQPAAARGAPPGAPAAGANAGRADAPRSYEDGIREAQKQGLLAFLWVSLLAGFLALLTPCVFPMVPITVSFFAKQRHDSPMGGLRGATAYALGIIATFTGLGIAVAVLFGASGINRLATNPWLNLALAVLFVALAANLFGVFEIVVPSGLLNRAQAGSRRGGLIGPLLMGLTFTLTSFTCTVPFVGIVLVSATQGQLVYPILGMLAFSAAFASPFFLLALFPQWLARMPKSGSWLTSVKAFMGFLEVAAALKFLSNADLVWQQGLLTRPVFLAVWAAIAAIAGFYLLGWLRLPHDDGTVGVGWPRRLVGVGTLGLAVMCLAGIEGASLGKMNAFLPPSPYPGRESEAGPAGPIVWLRDYDEALAKAKADGKPLFINFTGVTCTNCREMEANMFPRPEVVRELGHYIPVELYTDRDKPGDRRNQALQKRLAGEVTLPLYVALSPDGRVIAKFGGSTYDPAPFLAFLREGRSAGLRTAER